MKKLLTIMLTIMMVFFAVPLVSAQNIQNSNLPPERLAGLSHNIKNTGVMLPAVFDPYTETYLLTVANWVNNVRFTPYASTNSCIITVNGQGVASGQQSQVIKMTDQPQIATVHVQAVDGNGLITGETTYNIFLQRRPSERRTKISAGYITAFQKTDKGISITADLVTLTYAQNSNYSTFTNNVVDRYTYNTSENCLFYYGTTLNPIRAYYVDDFINNFDQNSLYNFVYIEDEIVAIIPY